MVQKKTDRSEYPRGGKAAEKENFLPMRGQRANSRGSDGCENTAVTAKTIGLWNLDATADL